MLRNRLFRVIAFAVACLLLVGCAPQGTAPDGSENPDASTPVNLDASGKYQLSANGEAIINDVNQSHLAPIEDNNRVFYEIFVGAFSDSNGDGIGDLRGIINRMDYLNDGDPNSGLSLGVEGIWLTPIFKSGSYHKYDVMDYYAIDPQFGTLEDLQELIDLCHERDVKIIIDLPINHTALTNSMFAKFMAAHRNGDTEDPYYDFYTYYSAGDTPPAGRTFYQLSGTTDYYEGNFSSEMPELNFDNEAVRQEVVNIAKFYLDMGMDGFRFDAAKYIYYGDNPSSVEFWVWYMDQLRAIKPDVYAVAEVWDGDGVTDLYYPALDCFNFSSALSNGIIADVAKGGNANTYTAYVENYVSNVKSMRADAMLMLFITNHDMDRAAGFLHMSKDMKMAANLYLLGPGSPFIYYGEELGMRGSRGGANTDANRRLGMVWGDGDTVKDPVGTTYDSKNQVELGAVQQMADGNQLYSHYKRLIMIRRANPEIARGEYKAIKTSSKLGAFTATWQGSTVCVLHNTTDEAITIDISTLGDFTTLADFIGSDTVTLDGTTLTIGAKTSAVLR